MCFFICGLVSRSLRHAMRGYILIIGSLVALDLTTGYLVCHRESDMWMRCERRSQDASRVSKSGVVWQDRQIVARAPSVRRVLRDWRISACVVATSISLCFLITALVLRRSLPQNSRRVTEGSRPVSVIERRLGLPPTADPLPDTAAVRVRIY